MRRLLGAGGFGEVYEAFDIQRNDTVALKILRKADAATLYRFKQEFRTLSLMVHPNLVTLYELIAEGDEWLLTMELVTGGSFLDYVRPLAIQPGGTPLSVPTIISEAVTVADVAAALRTRSDETAREPLPFEELRLDRLRSALRQLAEGVEALHRNRVLHLDIKPPNVLVDTSGRVVLVDFGLAQQLAATSDRTVKNREVLGTPEFMSPEQTAAEPLTEASDWYSVGALLYRALTGRAVFAGQVPQVLYAKLKGESVPPSDLVPGLPADLNTLCIDLLRRNPAQRPSGREVLARLGSTAVETTTTESFALPATAFVGRDPQLARLRASFDSMKQGRTSTVYVHGRSGMGKTALVTHFLGTLRRAESDVVVLEGRCYEHEAVPFKAFDAVLDALSDYLRRLPDSEVARLLPRGVGVLARVFPALNRVDVIAGARDRTRAPADPHELRRRAFAALREFFGRVAERHPVVIFIDDLQWGDVDSATLLDELLRPPDSPPLMLIASYRGDESESSACLKVLLSTEQTRTGTSKAVRIEVAELSTMESEALARALRPEATFESRIEAIAREAHGSPFFIDQLARHARQAPAGRETLDAVLWDRASQLPAAARSFMEVVAVASRPVEISVVAKAAGVDSGKYDVFASLRAARFLRSRARREGTEVESYHDRIRETFVAHLSAAALATHHLRLGEALEASASTDAEAMALHFHAGGDHGRAAVHAIVAAERFAHALAFDGAARLYRLALECGEGSGPGAAQLRIKLGGVLAMAGRVRESAEAYLAALDGADPADSIDLRRRAGEQYLLGGYLEEGLSLLKSTLADMGITLPSTTRRAFAALVLRHIYLRFRGIGFRERPVSEIPRFELQRLDMCHAVCRGLGFTDSIRAIELQSRHLPLALKAGDVYRIARALTFSATANGLRSRTRPYAERLLRRASHLATQCGNPHALSLVHSTTGFVRLASGRWREAVHELGQAETILRDECASGQFDSMPYEIVLCYIYKLEALYIGGSWKQYFDTIPGYLAECQGRGDIFAEASLRLRNAHRQCFVEDDPEGAAKELNAAAAAWRNEKQNLGRGNHLYRHVEVALYIGQIERAWQMINDRWYILQPLRLFGFELMMTLGFEHRAYCALAMAGRAAGRGESADSFLASAERDARNLERGNVVWGPSAAHLVRAGVAAHRDHRAKALEHLTSAEEGFEREGLALHRAVSRWRRGTLVGGDTGRTLVEESREWMLAQGVKDPDRVNRVYAPGLWAT